MIIITMTRLNDITKTFEFKVGDDLVAIEEKKEKEKEKTPLPIQSKISFGRISNVQIGKSCIISVFEKKFIKNY